MQAIVNWFLLVGQQWLSSLKVFLPNNFKLFILVTINAWWQGVKSFFKYFWWLFFVFFITQFFLYKNGMFDWVLTVSYIFSFACYVLFILALRPSVQPKNYSYYLHYLKYSFFFLLYLVWFNFIASFVLAPINFGIPFIENFLFGSKVFSTIIIAILGLFIANFISFPFFFFLDGQISMAYAFKSCVNGIKMLFYNLPFCFFTIFVLSGPMYLFNNFFPLDSLMQKIFLENSLAGLFLSLLIAVFNILYLQKLQEDSQLYH